MFTIKNLARKAIKLSIAGLILSHQLLAQGPPTTPYLADNATGIDQSNFPLSRNWSILQTDVSIPSYGSPLISRTTGVTSSSCLNSAISESGTFSVNVPGLSSPSYTWSVIGGLTIVGISGNTATVKPISQNGKFLPGKLIVDYTGFTTTTVPYTSVSCLACNTATICTTTNGFTTFQTPQSGRASVNLVQNFDVRNSPLNSVAIVGPRCIAKGDLLTYSIAPLVSSYLASDGYRWFQTTTAAAFSLQSASLYTSLDNSSITVSVLTAIGINLPTSLSVYIGSCNQTVTGLKTLVFSQRMADPIVALSSNGGNSCVPFSTTTVSASLTNLGLASIPGMIDPDQVDLTWYTDIPGGSVIGSSVGTSAIFNIGMGYGTIYLSTKAKTVPLNGKAALCTSNDVNIIKTIAILRGPSGTATITGPTCPVIGSTYKYAVVQGTTTLASSFTWTVPTGMTIQGTATANPLTVLVTGTLGGSTIGAVLQTNSLLGTCGILTVPNLTGISVAPSVTGIVGPSCLTPGTNVVFTPTLLSGTTATNYTWTKTGFLTAPAPTVGAGTFTVASNFTSGTISVVANKTGCASSNLYTVTVNALPAAIAAPTTPKTCLNSPGMVDAVSFTATAGYASYIWTVPAGWTVSGANNASVISFNTNGTSGSVSVKGINSCGTTPSSPVTTLSTVGIGAGIFVLATSFDDVDFSQGKLYSMTVPSGVTSCDPSVSNCGIKANGMTFLWSNGRTTQNVLLNTPSGANTYSVVYANTVTGCKTTSNVTAPVNYAFRKANSTAVDPSISVSPNPTSGDFTISLVGMTGAEVSIVWQVKGIVVKQYTMTSNTATISTADLVSGVYIVNATSNGTKVSAKLVVQK